MQAENLGDVLLLLSPFDDVVNKALFQQKFGALGLAVADEVWMTENAVYSVISPEGCASILWKDPAKVADAAECLKMTAADLYELGVVDRILLETGGDSVVFSTLKVLLARKLRALCAVEPDELVRARYNRFRAFGDFLTL